MIYVEKSNFVVKNKVSLTRKRIRWKIIVSNLIRVLVT